jgi:molybdate transport system regulatory protein
MARLTIRIDLGAESALGPGKARLLELIDAQGSIRRAANAMNMSYRRAWLLLKDIEDAMGAPVIAAETGGVKGGGASLTELGRAVVDRYRAIEEQAQRSVDMELRALSEMARPGGKASRRKPRRIGAGSHRKSATRGG